MKISAKDFRIHLNTLNRENALSIQQNANDYEVAQMTPSIPHPYELKHAVSFIEFAMQKYLLGEEFHLGIILDNELIGLCGLASIDSANKKAELGYWIGKNYWGNGYGKEAVRLMAHFCFSELKLNKIYAKVLTNNERSIKLLGKLGFCNEGKSREDIYHMGSFLDDYTFSLLKIDYKDRENFLVEQ